MYRMLSVRHTRVVHFLEPTSNNLILRTRKTKYIYIYIYILDEPFEAYWLHYKPLGLTLKKLYILTAQYAFVLWMAPRTNINL
jgi:hypothetical protein